MAKEKKERRSLFSLIFKSKNSNTLTKAERLQFLNGYSAKFTDYDGKIYEDPDALACIDAIARHAAKLSPKHYQKNNDNSSSIEKKLKEQPNSLMNSYYFIYYIVSQLEAYNEAFVFIARDENNNIDAFYPLTFGYYEFYEYQKEIYVKFSFGNGLTRFVSIKDLIHLRKYVSSNGVAGGTNKAVTKVLSVKHVLDEGIVNAIKTTQSIKGVIKESNSMLKKEDLIKARKEFEESLSGESGLGVLDATKEFKEIHISPVTASDTQMKLIYNKVLNYYGVSEEIIQSKYTEEQWNAFYESKIEPIAIQMSQEFTIKIFSTNERNHGNSIVFTANRIHYASNSTKIDLLRYASNIMMIDELREILDLPELPNGEGQKILQDLNHINSTIADQYQVGDSNKKGGKKDE